MSKTSESHRFALRKHRPGRPHLAVLVADLYWCCDRSLQRVYGITPQLDGRGGLHLEVSATSDGLKDVFAALSASGDLTAASSRMAGRLISGVGYKDSGRAELRSRALKRRHQSAAGFVSADHLLDDCVRCAKPIGREDRELAVADIQIASGLPTRRPRGFITLPHHAACVTDEQRAYGAGEDHCVLYAADGVTLKVTQHRSAADTPTWMVHSLSGARLTPATLAEKPTDDQLRLYAATASQPASADEAPDGWWHGWEDGRLEADERPPFARKLPSRDTVTS